MRKVILRATFWTIFAIMGTFYLLRGLSESWLDIALTSASFWLAFTHWAEVRDQRHQSNQS